MSSHLNVKAWIEAMRLRTLPVSVAGVIAGSSCAAAIGSFHWLTALICLLFAVVAQIASNFANEYYDYAKGLDQKGREGFRRGVTEGDLSPRYMKIATYLLIILDSLLGLTLLLWGGWWLIIPGVAIAIFALAYSAGPWPLSHHGLGDVAVVIFFGLVPVMLTCYVQAGWQAFEPPTVLPAFAIGIMSANVLIVNNYRDVDDDRLVKKNTTVVIFGRKIMATVYLLGGIIGAELAILPYIPAQGFISAIPAVPYLIIHVMLWRNLKRRRGKALNPLLGMTAMNLLLFTLIFTVMVNV